MAPTNGGISIPSQDSSSANPGGAPPPGDTASSNQNNGYTNGGGRSPLRNGGGDPPRRSSRSRSPGRRDRDDDRDRDSRREVNSNPGNNLHVSGLHHKVDTRDLETAFSKVGRVNKASVMYDPHTRESRGFGFVTMETSEEADAAIVALNSTELMGKIMTVEKARRARARTPTPGRYYGPPKRNPGPVERPYDPRPYDSRYSRDYDDRRDSRRGGRYDDYRRDDYRRDDYRDRDRGDRYRDDRRYDDRRY
ncbi:hypothetical protein H1R20_g10033, partial [Candolleomyces eurysporus]